MSWNSKPIWTEGMFLHPHHFQQQERYLERLVEGRTWPVTPYPWGFSQVEVDGNALRQGRFALRDAHGIAPDGTPFDFPQEEAPPQSIAIPPDARDEIVYLAVAERREGLREVGPEPEDSAVTRWRCEHVAATDNSAQELRKEDIEVGRLRLKYLMHRDNRSGFTCLPVARIVERDSAGTVQLAPDFIAPCLSAKDNPVLEGYMREVLGLIKQRADLIAKRAARPGYGAGAEAAQLLWLAALNRLEPVVAHLLTRPSAHPADVYALLASLAGELCTYARASRRTPEFPAYEHEQMHLCFAEVMDELRRSFRTVIEELAVALPLEKDATGLMNAQIPDVALTRSARFVLTVQASARTDSLRTHFPGVAKVAPSDVVMQFARARAGAMPLRALEAVPPEIPYYQKAVYFELLRDPDPLKLWTRLETSGSLGIYVMDDVPNLALELWAIRTRN